MPAITELVDRYIAIWNETDNDTRRTLIAQTWTEDAHYLDPLMEAEGHNGINGMTQGVQQQFRGFTFRRTSDVDQHHDCLRFSWELGPASGPAVVKGVDFGVIVGDRLQSITGFLDFVPKAAE